MARSTDGDGGAGAGPLPFPRAAPGDPAAAAARAAAAASPADPFDALSAGVALARGPELRLTRLNAAFEAALPEAATGRTLAEAAPELDAPAFLARHAERGRAEAEFSARSGRRQKVWALTARPFGDETLLELRDVSRVAEMRAMIDSFSEMADRRARELAREKERVEKLLLNLMPRSIYEEFKTFGVVSPQRYEPVSVLMLDFAGFTEMAVARDPQVTVSELNDIFSTFDRIGEQFGCERIKTIGDAYVAVAGLPHADPDHAQAAARCALRFIRWLEKRNASHPHQWRCRIGIASGPVVGCVVGVHKYVYDVFGPPVNLAARLQAQAEPMTVAATAEFAAGLGDAFQWSAGEVRDLRGFGEVDIRRVEARRG
ncbi:adenylate/guanylate cyclase domain-containing protein [Albimonas sp. CAU 1670]|uniref:adenylate/guanylate cyclase domain-containing protein n=1 Tax=Albimonas sp. CAU 1670 TaxID=3032599 RepID=UPI0023D9BE3A|nr:adenylate/guanylate cyclase domain-containing protein [Albimonas sp. CAU 1670]MDF2235465.1 adenylate/guanylate cyclase domain-containing protein [Albimonas sp. CAU 1670]